MLAPGHWVITHTDGRAYVGPGQWSARRTQGKAFATLKEADDFGPTVRREEGVRCLGFDYVQRGMPE